MADKTHHYQVSLDWTGDRGSGTSGYASYERAHVLGAPGKPVSAAGRGCRGPEPQIW